MELANVAMVVAGIAIVFMLINIIGKVTGADSSSSRVLQKKFISMGNMTGKSLEEIKSVAGEPSISEFIPDGAAYTWDSPKYAIKLKFDQNKKCVGKLGEVVKK